MAHDNDSLRVAHFSATFPPYYAGAGNACFYQARELAARGHQVTVFTATYPGEPVDPAGVEVRRIEPLLRIGNAPLLPALAAVRGYDVIHLYQPFIFGTEGALVSHRRSRVPIVSSFQNELVAPGLKGAVFRVYNQTVTRAAVRASAQLTVLSLDHARSVPVLAAELQRRPEAFCPVPNGVDVRAFSPGDGSAYRAELKLGPDDLVGLICAKLDAAHTFKRVDVALGALAAWRTPTSKLLVLGGGELQPTLVQMARDLGVSEQVIFLGDRPHDEVVGYYRACDYCVLPSDSVESFGIVQAEAMACGKPVIVSALPGVRDVSIDGVHGFHIRPGDQDDLLSKLTQFAALDPDARARMGEAGRAHVVSNYSWEHTAEILEGAYRSAAAPATV